MLHERAATFDGRNHLVYFSPGRCATCSSARVSRSSRPGRASRSLDPVLEWLAYEEPYSDADSADDPLVAGRRARGEASVERLLEELDLGYKLHCLATKRP